MTELTTTLCTMHRPKTLVRAARFAAAAHRQRRIRTLGKQAPIDKLIEEEERIDSARRMGDAGYSPTRHVEVLTQLLTAASRSAT